MFRIRLWLLLTLVVGWADFNAHAQIDPVQRELIQMGYAQSLEGHAPLSGYGYYYYNQPSFERTNLTLRLAVAPVYLDSELGIAHALGPLTDLGIGLAGGGFADSYNEVRQGKYLPEESFTGHGGVFSASIYHLFNPHQLVPLNGILRGEAAYTAYARDSETAPNFTTPLDQTSFNVRTGLRLGGKEPLLAPDIGLELSVWYEGRFRLDPGHYGFNGDREVEAASHLFWARALFAYTLPKRKDNFMLSVTAGTSARVDRFSAYRIGGVLPLASEFPLSLPGYYYQELSAERFALADGIYYLPLDSQKRWQLTAVAATALIDFAPGLEQPGHWNSGVGGGITYQSRSHALRISLGYGYGFQAIRSHGRGAQTIGLLMQIDLEHTAAPFFSPDPNSPGFRGLDNFLHSLF